MRRKGSPCVEHPVDCRPGLGHLAHLKRTGVSHSVLAIGRPRTPWDRIHERQTALGGPHADGEPRCQAVEFYSGMLGLDVAYNSEPAFAMIKVPGAVGGTIGLLSFEEARKEGATETTADQKRGVHVEFTTADLDALYVELTAKGMRHRLCRWPRTPAPFLISSCVCRRR